MNARSILAQCALFQGLTDAALDQLATLAERHELPSGECLYERGDAPAYFCVLTSGRMRVSVGDTLVGYTGQLEPVGEISILTGEPRTADVHAIRDSLLLRIPREPFVAFLHQYPAALMALTRLVVTRLRENQRQKREASAPSPSCPRDRACLCACWRNRWCASSPAGPRRGSSRRAMWMRNSAPAQHRRRSMAVKPTAGSRTGSTNSKTIIVM